MTTDIQDKPYTREAIDALRARLAEFKKGPPEKSYTELAQLTGVPRQTLAAWVPGTYDGGRYFRNMEIPDKVERFFASLDETIALASALPDEPGFLDTPTSKSIQVCLALAHQGDITMVSTAPGCGKTESIKRYRRQRANVFVVTASPSSRGVQDLLSLILISMGEKVFKGTPRALSNRIKERVAGANALIIVDEAQHLSDQTFEELRAIHDETACGFAFAGDQNLPKCVRAHAQLHSRIGARFILGKSAIADIDVVADGWGVSDTASLRFLRKIGAQQGGLRTITKTMRLARRLAHASGQPLCEADLADAYAQRYAEHS